MGDNGSERKRSCWSELDRRRSHSQRKSQMVRKASWVERKSLWDSMLHESDEKESDFIRLLEDLKHRITKKGPGTLFVLYRCLKCAMCLDTDTANPLLNHLYRVLLPQLLGSLYMNEPRNHWHEDADLENTDEILLKCLVLTQDLCSDSLRFLAKSGGDEDKYENALALLRLVTTGIDKTKHFHRTHRHRTLPMKEFTPHGAHRFTRCIASSDKSEARTCSTCHKPGASVEFRWISVLLENFGQANWTNYEFLARILENPRVLPLEATEAVLGFVAPALEFLDPALAQKFLPGCLAVMELLVDYDQPGARPSDRFISTTLVIDKHLDDIYAVLLSRDARAWLIKFVRVCGYRDMLGFKPIRLW